LGRSRKKGWGWGRGFGATRKSLPATNKDAQEKEKTKKRSLGFKGAKISAPSMWKKQGEKGTEGGRREKKKKKRIKKTRNCRGVPSISVLVKEKTSVKKKKNSVQLFTMSGPGPKNGGGRCTRVKHPAFTCCLTHHAAHERGLKKRPGKGGHHLRHNKLKATANQNKNIEARKE